MTVVAHRRCLVTSLEHSLVLKPTVITIPSFTDNYVPGRYLPNEIPSTYLSSFLTTLYALEMSQEWSSIPNHNSPQDDIPIIFKINSTLLTELCESASLAGQNKHSSHSFRLIQGPSEQDCVFMPTFNFYRPYVCTCECDVLLLYVACTGLRLTHELKPQTNKQTNKQIYDQSQLYFQTICLLSKRATCFGQSSGTSIKT